MSQFVFCLLAYRNGEVELELILRMVAFWIPELQLVSPAITWEAPYLSFFLLNRESNWILTLMLTDSARDDWFLNVFLIWVELYLQDSANTDIA